MSLPADPSTVHQINLPGPVVTKVVAVPVPWPGGRRKAEGGRGTLSASASRLPPSALAVGATDVAVTSWWQEAWVALYKLLR